MKRPTRAFLHEARQLNGYTLKDFLHGYIYARWPYLYIGVGVGTHPLARAYTNLLKGVSKLAIGSHHARQNGQEIANNYHGKVITKESAKKLVLIREELNLRDLERVIPFPKARDIVLHNPEQIVALECPCRAAREDPCFPLDVCMIVGEPFAGFILEHHPQRSRRLTQTEAVRMLEEEHERGHVHHAFFKDAMLGRFYAICNCCSCCCGAMQLMRNGIPMIISSGYVVRSEKGACIGCGSCVEACNFEAIRLVEGFASFDHALCMGCGICVDTCQQGALSLERDPSKGEPLEILNLMEASLQSHSARV
jgi:ferredoxin